MRRSTRCMPSLSSPYTGIFQTCIDVSDAYTRQLNLSPLILHLPLDEQLNDADLYGLTVRLSRNKSFIKTKKNLNPPFYPCNVDPYLQRVDLCDGDAKVDSLVQSLTNSLNGDTRPGILVMFTQPPLKKEEITEYNNLTPMKTELFNQSKIRDQTIVQDFSDYRPLTGVLIKIGSITPNMHNQEAGHLHDEKSHITNGITPTVSDRLERSIVGAFCRQSVPDDVAEEILRVTFVRSIVEALCYEDTLLFYQNNRKKTSNSTKSCVLASYGCTQWYYNTSLPIISQTDIPDKDKRFVSINTGDLVLCPFVLLPTLLRRLRFSMHWDREEGSNDFIHEDTNAECSCMKKVRNNLQLQKSQLTGNGNKSNTTSALSESIQNEFYQFFTLNSKRFKGLLENNMCSLIESTPSEATLKFCIDNTRNVKNHIDQVSVSENRETKRKRTHQT
ncbi:uncharacterized protein LOC128883743 [Hylaeus volcanicus]|uniref:uncharacterized protein LOC128883743 n=1 Tax=Hylaeus volcanicus TaxID=313075 RepID=UPI0023B82D23|nr:uncharacterized protein LOC128883743 [Hylaeus volcanicus]XP_053992399.1 uncharacterized protein LOC128883743 [Hylaeus volcanicus]